MTNFADIAQQSPAARAWRDIDHDLASARQRASRARARILKCDEQIEQCEDRGWRKFARIWRARRVEACQQLAAAQQEIGVCLIAQYYLVHFHETNRTVKCQIMRVASPRHHDGLARAINRWHCCT